MVAANKGQAPSKRALDIIEKGSVDRVHERPNGIGVVGRGLLLRASWFMVTKKLMHEAWDVTMKI